MEPKTLQHRAETSKKDYKALAPAFVTLVAIPLLATITAVYLYSKEAKKPLVEGLRPASQMVVKKAPYEGVRTAICTTGCAAENNYEEPMFLSHAYEVNKSKGSKYRTIFYKDNKKDEVLMEGVGDDKVRYFRRIINGELLVQGTRKNAGVWGHVDYYRAEEAEKVWATAIARYDSQ